jgi:glycosyltransferase involved in cell wall biosynthesis
MLRISVLIITKNEEENIEDCLMSVKWADEILVIDTGSTDKTVELAKKYATHVYTHPTVNYVEPVRNFAITKASGDWILFLDADERIPDTLSKELPGLTNEKPVAYKLSRKNIIFGKWIKHTGWWPDYNVRFFKKGSVSWNDEIHSQPKVEGITSQLESNEELAILHYNYISLSQYLSKMFTYTTIQAEELIEKEIKIQKSDFITHPFNEFMRRYFAEKGYRDGVHGFVLSFLQGFSEFLVITRVWEKEGFKEDDKFLDVLTWQWKKIQKEMSYWIYTSKIADSKNYIKKMEYKIKRKIG